MDTPRKAGRPKGSLNKVKVAVVVEPPTPAVTAVDPTPVAVVAPTPVAPTPVTPTPVTTPPTPVAKPVAVPITPIEEEESDTSSEPPPPPKEAGEEAGQAQGPTKDA